MCDLPLVHGYHTSGRIHLAHVLFQSAVGLGVSSTVESFPLTTNKWNDFNSSIATSLATSAPESPTSSCQQSFFVENSPLSASVLVHPIHQSTPLGSHMKLEERSEISDSRLVSSLINDLELDAPMLPGTSGSAIQPSSTSQLSSVLGVTCCENRCLAGLSLLELETSQKSFRSRKKVEQQQFLLDAVHSHLSVTDGNTSKCMLSIAGKKVCKLAFGNIFGLSAKRMRRVTSLLVEGM